MANKPFLLSDNFYDTAVLHPDHVVTVNLTEAAGAEAFHLWDNLRDTTTFAVTETNAVLTVTVDCGTAKVADCLVLDRGHNAKGRTSAVATSVDGVTWVNIATPGILSAPGANGLGTAALRCLTNEGVWWLTWTPVASRYWRFSLGAVSGVPQVLAGLYLGERYRLPAYLEAPGAYDYRTNIRVLKNELSHAGLRVKRGIRAFDEVDLKLKLEEADYNTFHSHATRLLRYNAPWWFCLDDADAAGCDNMRLFQLPGDLVYDPVLNPAVREVSLLLEEVAPLARV